MRIGLLIHPCEPEKPGGLGRSNFALVETLLRESTEHSYVIYLKGVPRPMPFSTYPRTTVRFTGPGPLWLTGALALDPTLDAYIFFSPIIPLFFRPHKSVVIVFDFAFLEMTARSLKERFSNWFLYRLQSRSLRMATNIVAISNATRNGVVRHFGIPQEKVKTMHIGYMPLPAETKFLPVPEKFFLFPGVLKERKNIAGIIRAFALFQTEHSEHALLIAGKKEGAYYESLVRLVRELGIETQVRFVGYVRNDELAYLYEKAVALVFPSFVEGFGMPVLEAMHAGLPVITSNTGALAEVAGDAAILVNPRDVASIAQALSALAQDKALRDTLRKRGYVHAAEFSWQKAARILLAHVTSL